MDRALLDIFYIKLFRVDNKANCLLDYYFFIVSSNSIKNTMKLSPNRTRELSEKHLTNEKLASEKTILEMHSHLKS